MASIKINEVIHYLETFAPPAYQENYDNSGLITGDASASVKGILISLDCTEDIVDEAIARDCNLIISHHPILFKPIKRITGATYVERTLLRAIKHDIALYAIHTNLDHIHEGVNKKIADRLGLQHTRILLPRPQTLAKLVFFVPKEHTTRVLDELYAAGAGQIGKYDRCSFVVDGTGSFRPKAGASPHIGEVGQQEFVAEDRVEIVFPSFLEPNLIKSLKRVHPYEEVAHYITALTNENQDVGAGLIGTLPEAMEPKTFLDSLKVNMELKFLRHTSLLPNPIKQVAVCGGAGSFLIPHALRNGADAFVTADLKYHDFFEADGRMLIADIGHYESEVFTIDLLQEVLTKKFSTFAINFSKRNTNPISYY